jgi:predicted negative regulator of RcsB-dependent stress response
MTENLYEAQYDVTKRSKFKRFYQENKIIIFSFIFIIVILFLSFTFYLSSQENKKILLSENFLQAKILLERGDKDNATILLKKVILENEPTYSSLSLFLIMNQNLISDRHELSNLFDHLLENNNFPKEIKNLIIYKKVLLNSDFTDESNILKSIKPLLNNDSDWEPHALLLLGDYFISKGESTKAIEFYQKILTMKNLQKDFYNHASLQLAIIANE